ncbi:dipicolinate synthase subunit B [Ruminococcus sp.]|uniref:dipicolinate synthase subunit B n=1 Tax=Ruminococcus sp. TaxID=41978 RepID=UPI00388DF8E9
MEKIKLGYAMTGSFCTLDKSIREMARLAAQDYDVLPIMSENVYTVSTRFGKAQDIVTRVEDITRKSVIHTVSGSEPIGPRRMCDILLVAPCTGNTLSKIALGITDTPVTMAVKSQLRIGAPVVLCIASNDALGASAENIGKLLNRKNVYFVPLSQDDPQKKPNSLVSHFDQIPQALEEALKGRQLQPIFSSGN